MVTLFLAGILVAVAVEELTGVSPGGMVAAPFLAIILGDWRLLVLSIAVTVVTFLLLRFAETWFLLYGRRRLGYAILVGLFLKAGFLTLFPHWVPSPTGLAMVGYVVPGVVAEWCMRQGFWKTQGTLALALSVLTLLRIGLAP